MIRRLSITLLVTLFISTMAQAATTVRGRVLAVDGTPYPSAAVTLQTSSGAKLPTVYTGGDGMFYVPNVAPGAYKMNVRTSRSEASFSVNAQSQAYSDVAPVNVR